MYVILKESMDWDLFEKFESDNTTDADTDNDLLNKKCYSCSSTNIEYVHENSQFVCSDCGVILCIMMDKAGDHSEGAAINVYLPKASLGTTVSGNFYMKLRVVNGWMRWVYKEKAFFEDTKYLETKCYAARIHQSVLDNALYLYKKVLNSNKIIRGPKRKGTMAACVYYGAQMQKKSYSVVEISTAFDVSRHSLSQGCAIVTSIMDTTHIMHNNNNCITDFTNRFSTELSLSDATKERARELAENIMKLEIAENFQPPSIAATIMLLIVDIDCGVEDAAKKNITCQKLHERFNISQATINKAYKKIYPWKMIISNTEITDEYMKSL
jgi:transcription initiation factor TFIIIB Brf1 subunit/transcription initiation factor TFIIB